MPQGKPIRCTTCGGSIAVSGLCGFCIEERGDVLIAKPARPPVNSAKGNRFRNARLRVNEKVRSQGM